MPRLSTTATHLLRFMRERRFVRFMRRFDMGFTRGYVLDVGPKFFMIGLQGDGIRFDGFSCYRIADVRSLRRDPYAAFAEAAMKKLKEPIPRKPKVSVAKIEELLQSASRTFPLITIHREEIRPDACWIGKVESIADENLFFCEIGPDAKWDHKLGNHKLNEITAVEFGGEYETALFAVGGGPPLMTSAKKRKTSPR